MKAYDNYIFDLYGTLADIHTEENDPLVWKKLALFYGYYDADYSSEELKERYAAIIAGEESKMKSEKKDDAHEAHPEVQIEEVFQKLFEEKGVKADPTLAVHAGQFFRILSTDYVKLYDGVTDLLEALKKKGKKIYLLSNAQRIFTEYEMHTHGRTGATGRCRPPGRTGMPSPEHGIVHRPAYHHRAAAIPAIPQAIQQDPHHKDAHH